MVSGESLILKLEAESAISEWRRLIGPMLDAKEHAPESLRALYQVGEVNPIHAASNASQVKLELDMFFGSSETKPLPVESTIAEPEAEVVEQAATESEEPSAEVETVAKEEAAAATAVEEQAE